MIAALDAHFSSNPTIKIVAAGFANANSEDWNVPHTPSEVVAWFDAGYTTEKLLVTGSTMFPMTRPPSCTERWTQASLTA